MATAQLNGDVLAVSGDINFATVVELRDQGAALIREQAADLEVDLSAVGHVNTAAMALLLSWYRTAQQAQIQLHYQNTPKALHAIAEMSDLSSLLDSAG